MAQKSGIVDQIKEIRARYGDGNSYSELFSRLSKIERAAKDFDPRNEELLRYFPVAMVACMEGYFRLAMKELIDGGEQFLSRSETLFKRDLKVDFLMLKEVHGKSLTLGELIAHLTRCNNLSDINSNISTLLGCDFLEGLRLVHDRWDHEVSKNPRVPIISNPDKTYRSVDEIFSLRHIICHELANDKKFTFEKIQELIKDCSTFLKASREFIAEKLHPGYPLTQSDMNEWTGLELKKSLDKMEDIERKIVGILNEEEVKKFYQLQRDWAAYAEKWISFDADNFLGGTIRHSIYNSVHKEEVDSRIKTLEQYYEKYKRMRS